MKSKVMKVVVIIAVMTGLFLAYKPIMVEMEARKMEKIKIVCLTETECTDASSQQWTEKVFTRKQAMKAFVKAENSASKISGALNYMVEFEMIWMYSNGKTEHYHLTLRETRGERGLIVPFVDSHTGYSVSRKDADRLRELVYSEPSDT